MAGQASATALAKPAAAEKDKKEAVSAKDKELPTAGKCINNMYVAAEAMAMPGVQELVMLIALVCQPLYTDHSATARAMTSQEEVL